MIADLKLPGHIQTIFQERIQIKKMGEKDLGKGCVSDPRYCSNSYTTDKCDNYHNPSKKTEVWSHNPG